MKVLYLHNYFHVKSGSNVIMFEEAELMKKSGHEVFYFCTDKKPYYDENYQYLHFFPKFIDTGKLSPLSKILNCYRPFYNHEAVKKFGRLLDEVKPDVVHDHTITFYLTPFILNECYKRGIPVIKTIHSGKSVPLSGKKENRLADSIKNFSLFNIYKNLVYLFYEISGVFKNISYYIFPSDALSTSAEFNKIPKEKIVVIHNFIKQENKEEAPGTNSNYFLFAGRLVNVKGIYELVEAWKNLPKEINLHIVGTGEEEKNLKRIVAENKLTNIQFLGFLDGKELEAQYKNCIASILPSIWLEAFGLTILESFNYNKPAIASNVGGIREIIENNANGILVEPYNIKEIKDAVKKLYYDQELAVEMGRRGRYTLENKFTPEVHCRKLISLYEKTVNRN